MPQNVPVFSYQWTSPLTPQFPTVSILLLVQYQTDSCISFGRPYGPAAIRTSSLANATFFFDENPLELVYFTPLTCFSFFPLIIKPVIVADCSNSTLSKHFLRKGDKYAKQESIRLPFSSTDTTCP